MKNTSNVKPLTLAVTNFGPIVEAKIDLRPLTVFVGPSNTGKSYLAMLVYALHRFMRRFPLLPRSSWDELDISDENIESLVAWRDLVWREDAKLHQDSRIPVPDAIASLIRPVFNHMHEFAGEFDREIRRCFGVDKTRQLIRHPGNNSATVTLRHHVQDDEDPFAYTFSTRGAAPELTASIPNTIPLWMPLKEWDERYGWRLGLHLLFSHISSSGLSLDENRERAERLLYELFPAIFPYTVGEVYRPAHYLPADRAGMMHSYRVVVGSLIEGTTVTGRHPDASISTLPGVMADFFKQLIAFNEGSDLNQDVVRGLEENILTGTVSVERSEIYIPQFLYTPQGWNEPLPLVNTSSMVSELAPVVLYLRHVVAPGDLLIIEEPESHLHPAMQVAFIRQLAAAVRAGIRVIITTHSDWVLEEVANMVTLAKLPKAHREGIEGGEIALDESEVGAWLFKTKKRPKGSVVQEIPLDKESGIFPSDFDDVSLDLYNKGAEIFNRLQRAEINDEPR